MNQSRNLWFRPTCPLRLQRPVLTGMSPDCFRSVFDLVWKLWFDAGIKGLGIDVRWISGSTRAPVVNPHRRPSPASGRDISRSEAECHGTLARLFIPPPRVLRRFEPEGCAGRVEGQKALLLNGDERSQVCGRAPFRRTRLRERFAPDFNSFNPC